MTLARVGVCLGIAFGLTASTSFAEQIAKHLTAGPATRCFEIQNSTLMGPVGVPAEIIPPSVGQIWCYWSSESQVTWVYPQNDLRLELTAKVESSQEGLLKSITHASLTHGKLTVVKTGALPFSPLGVPLTIQEASRVALREVPALKDSDWGAPLFNVGALTAFDEPTLLTGWDQVVEGSFESYIDGKMPWRGYWWPFENSPLSRGNDAPLKKYDRAYQSRHGSMPGAADWESRNHSLAGVAWGGHCNGWAAASILYPEPNSSKTDLVSNVQFSITDQKALLTELSFCVQYAFYGKRFNNARGDDLLDIDPATFHQVIGYYIGGLKKPVAMDYMPDEKVDNHIATGYRMKIDKISGGSNRFRVRLSMRMAQYDQDLNTRTGAANLYQRNFQYTLDTDPSGKILFGQWESANPDFLWVPLAQRSCEWENPNLNESEVLSFVTGSE